MDDDECPDSTVMDDDDIEMADLPFAHHQRRSFDEPQSSRVSSTGSAHYPQPNFSILPQQLPPLPKLIFRPPAHGGNYPSVSFSSHQGGLTSRLSAGGSSSSLSRGDNQAASRLSSFPSSRSESFPGTRINLNAQSSSRAELPLPRLEAMSRSELTISRVSSTPTRGEGVSGLRIGGVSSTSRNDFPRVGGVSISRISDGAPFARVGSTSGHPPKIEIPQLTRIGSSLNQQLEISPSRKFGRRFLKPSPAAGSKASLPAGPSRMPMSMMRASSTEEYYSPGSSSGNLQGDDPMSVDNESAMDFASSSSSIPKSSGMRRSGLSSTATSRKSGLAVSETLTSHPGSQGIKIHISKKQLEVIDVDDSSSERSSNSMASLQNNSDSNIGSSYDFSTPPSMSITASSSKGVMHMGEMSVKPVRIKVPPKERLPIPSDIMMNEAEDTSKDSEALTSDNDEGSRQSEGPSFLQHLIIQDESGQVVQLDDSARRSRRKRQPVAPSPESPPKVRKRRGAASASMGRGEAPPLIPLLPGTPESGVSPVRGRGRGTGRGRGRPRGSTNKARMERELLLKQQLDQETERVRQESPGGDVQVKAEGEEQEGNEAETKEVTVAADTTSPDVDDHPKPSFLEGDPEVNAEISSAETPTKKTRGGRGSRGGTPRGGRGSRGARGSKTVRERKSPEAKKAKAEKKEAIKAPPPVQVFEEETRMSADIKPPVPDRVGALTAPVVLDEESRASNVSSTSTSTTAKAKRFTKDPIEERKPVTAETLYEYQWPLNDKNADFFFLQEQISEYLGVKSFKRKYPDIRRRVVDMEERDFLRDSKVVSETQCDLGLTAVHSCDVLDIMFNDFPEKYEEYRKVYQERKEAEMSKLKPSAESDSPAVRDRSAEFMRRILKSCAKWNMTNNRERKEERVCSFDLQTGTLHYPKNMMKVLPERATKMGHFPVAVLPGQFTDNYKEYTPDELFYLPLNTVRYGPISENWVVDSDSESESSDSDDSSSDDSSGSSSDDENGSIGDSEQNMVVLSDDAGNVLYRGPPGKTKVSVEATCKTCDGGAQKNKDGNPEVLLHCSRCDVANHPTCLELALDMLPFITKYHWECTECKNCIECNDPADEDKMLFCDCCDRGYHIYCVGLRKVPTGRWHCSVCSVCYSCGATQPSPEDRMAEWHHEFKKGEKGSKFYTHSLCVACYKLYKKGHYCPSCTKVHAKFDSTELLECRKCEKWVHKTCVKRPLTSMFGFMCDPCDANFRSRSKLPSHVN